MAAGKKTTKRTSTKKVPRRRDAELPPSYYEGKKKGYRPPKDRNGLVMPG